MKSILIEDCNKSKFLEKIDAALAPYTPEQVVDIEFSTAKFAYEPKFYALIIVNAATTRSQCE